MIQRAFRQYLRLKYKGISTTQLLQRKQIEEMNSYKTTNELRNIPDVDSHLNIKVGRNFDSSMSLGFQLNSDRFSQFDGNVSNFGPKSQSMLGSIHSKPQLPMIGGKGPFRRSKMFGETIPHKDLVYFEWPNGHDLQTLSFDFSSDHKVTCLVYRESFGCLRSIGLKTN